MAKDITTPVFIGTILAIFVLCGLTLMSIEYNSSKPISYPEEIQAVRAGDTLYVSSVSDSIYIGFKPLNK